MAADFASVASTILPDPRSKSVNRRRRAPAARSPRIGLALAGGGPLGAIYEIGALAALCEALRGVDFNDCDVYVGVSAGGFIAAGLVNGYTPHLMSRLFIEGHRSDERFDLTFLAVNTFLLAQEDAARRRVLETMRTQLRPGGIAAVLSRVCMLQSRNAGSRSARDCAWATTSGGGAGAADHPPGELCCQPSRCAR